MIPFDGSEQELDGTPHGGLYSLNDLREITAYARSQGITVVPEIDLPAHASAVLAAVPPLRVPGIDVPEVTCRFTPPGRVASPRAATRAAPAPPHALPPHCRPRYARSAPPASPPVPPAK